MKNISINGLQKQISSIIREVEGGGIYQISRYSKPVAFLISKECYEELISGHDCKKCMEDLRKLTKKIK